MWSDCDECGAWDWVAIDPAAALASSLYGPGEVDEMVAFAVEHGGQLWRCSCGAVGVCVVGPGSEVLGGFLGLVG